MSKERIRTSFAFLPEIKRRLDNYSEATGRSKLHIIESAITEYLNRLEAQK